MIECALCDEILSEEMPGSLLAAASLLLSLKFTRQLDNLQITKRFYKHQPYKREELEKSIEKILKVMQQVPKSLYHTNVREKYKRSEFDRVATYQYSNDLGKYQIELYKDMSILLFIFSYFYFVKKNQKNEIVHDVISLIYLIK